ncbi:hypothetical protein MKQ68_13330 [Chitinophaga horti]|uniref:Uncharacterized protein n=1 Tax=Chitinophaga horti TaxID=2920382 RepID=A0ABY6IUW1_9BACT|nr:hypothetical protein [Chitinophaga horti]UYQ91075.1 hypothetical protein MKQ68_13330 [Chitinophaga horti]
MKRIFVFTLLLSIVSVTPIAAQDSTIAALKSVPAKYLSEVSSKSKKFEQKLTKRTEKVLSRFRRQEAKMQQKLSKIDSVAANNIFTRSLDSLGNLKANLHKRTAKYGKALNGQYNGYLDTLTNSLSFLKDSKEFLGKSKAVTDKLNGSLQSVKDLQAKLQYAEQVKTYIRERREQLKNQLSQYTAFSKDLQKLNKEAYYYAQQVREYKEVFKDRKKAEAKALELLQKTKAFNNFMEKNSQLAGLFNMRQLTGGSGMSSADLEQSLAGLQTRTQVEQLIQQRMGGAAAGGSGPNANAAVSQQMDAARAQFDELKKNFPDVDNAAEMPDFKPNEMKTKSFLQRLEFGGNVQFQRSNQYFPTTSDIAGQVAYKFHKNGSAGMGLAYKLGIGTGWDNIAFSNQGVGFRSFVDWKLKGTFFLNGGYEQNYNIPFSSLTELKNADTWTGSGLIGISKKYKISNKLKGTAILLFDFLANTHVPRTDPIKFRLGYNF